MRGPARIHGWRLMVASVIFVEGVAGAGKSSTAQFIAREFERQGYAAKWLYESGVDNGLAYAPGAGSRSSAEHAMALVGLWRAFMATHTSQAIVVVDGAFQSALFKLLSSNAPTDVVDDLCRRLQRLAADQSALLVYLRPTDVQRTLEVACVARYPTLMDEYVQRCERSEYAMARGLSGIGSLVSFWRDFQVRTDRIFDDWGEDAVKVTTEDWEASRAVICEALALNPPSEPLASVPERYVGEYAYRIAEALGSFRIDVANGRLIAKGLVPYLWEAGTELIPVGADEFEGRSRPTLLRFRTERDVAIGVDVMTRLRGAVPHQYCPRVAE